MVTSQAGSETHRTFTGPWNGDSQIVIGVDIGTTFSGVAYTFLQTGSNQQLYRVDKWPGQQYHNSSGKIPTVVWYDANGKAVSFGAEAVTSQAKRNAKANQWELAKEFKLHMHPAGLRRRDDITVRNLPDKAPIDKIYSDFLRYLLEHTKSRFEQIIGDGKKIWEDYHSKMVLVIAHPNAWGPAEQSFLRNAAIATGFVTSENAQNQVRVVTEAEASVHFCMHYTNLKTCLDVGTNFAICDAGGSTVDTTLYNVNEKQPLFRLGEVQGSACVQAGAIYVNDKAEEHLRNFFNNSAANLSDAQVNEYVTGGIEYFETQTKRQFGSSANEDEKIPIKFAGDGFMNDALGVMYGEVSLESAVVRSFFDPCVEAILENVNSLVMSTGIKYIVLVGGFGANTYLLNRLSKRFGSTGCEVITTTEATSKAVADGAVIWHGANTVFKRAPRFAYGTDYVVSYEPSNPEHRGRKTHESPGGCRVHGAWAEIVPKDTPVDCDSVHRHTFGRVYPTPIPPLWGKISDDIYSCSSGGLSKWLTNESEDLNEGFQKVCTITGNLSDMSGGLALGVNPTRGACCWILEYDVCIRFGRTELEAFMEWKEEGVRKTGAATILPISSIERS